MKGLTKSYMRLERGTMRTVLVKKTQKHTKKCVLASYVNILFINSFTLSDQNIRKSNDIIRQ